MIPGVSLVLPSEQSRGVDLNFSGELGILRDGVGFFEGSEFRVISQLARMTRDDTVVLLDLWRHERWIVEA